MTVTRTDVQLESLKGYSGWILWLLMNSSSWDYHLTFNYHTVTCVMEPTLLVPPASLTDWDLLSEGQRDEEEGKAHGHAGHDLVHGELRSNVAVSSLVRVLQQKVAEHVLRSHVCNGHVYALLLPVDTNQQASPLARLTEVMRNQLALCHDFGCFTFILWKRLA